MDIVVGEVGREVRAVRGSLSKAFNTRDLNGPPGSERNRACSIIKPRMQVGWTGRCVLWFLSLEEAAVQSLMVETWLRKLELPKHPESHGVGLSGNKQTKQSQKADNLKSLSENKAQRLVSPCYMCLDQRFVRANYNQFLLFL